MKKSIKIIIGISMVIILSLITLLFIWQNSYHNSYSPDIDLNDPNLITINTGTQGRFEDLSVGLGDIKKNTANLYFNLDGTNDSSMKKVVVGDKFEIYSYRVEVKAVETNFNLSFSPGANHGNVKLIITKK